MPSQKFATQADAELLKTVREIAAQEGRPFHSIIDEALCDFVEKRRQGAPRPHVMAAFDASLSEFDRLYDALAK